MVVRMDLATLLSPSTARHEPAEQVTPSVPVGSTNASRNTSSRTDGALVGRSGIQPAAVGDLSAASATILT